MAGRTRDLRQHKDRVDYATGLNSVMVLHCQREIQQLMSCQRQTDRKRVEIKCLRHQIAVDDCLEDIPTHYDCIEVVQRYGECLKSHDKNLRRGHEDDEEEEEKDECKALETEALDVCFPHDSGDEEKKEEGGSG